MTHKAPGEVERILALREQLLLQRKLNDAIKADGLSFYTPHAIQHSFHAAGDRSRRGLFTGNRCGKSQCGAAEDAAWLRGERSWYKRSFDIRDGRGRVVLHHDGGENHSLVRSGIPTHPVKGLVITEDWELCTAVWTNDRGEKPGKIWKYLPRGFVKSKKRNSLGAIEMIECANGSTLSFDTAKSWKTNPGGVESKDWDFIHVDEPCPEGMFKGAARGLVDRRGFAWFTLTALSEPWIQDYIAEHGWSQGGSIYDNPYLTAQAIAEYEALLTPDERQCRLFGIPLNLVGLVYKEFNAAHHVLPNPPQGWRDWLTPPEDWSIYVSIDPHPQTPHAVLFCAVSPAGHRIYYTDIFEHCVISKLCERIKQVLGGREAIAYHTDPSAWVKHPTDDTSMADEFWRCGISVSKSVKDLQRGILKVKEALLCQPQVVWFSPECRRTLWEMRRYRWEPDGQNKPVDKDDHCMECLYRIELMNPIWVSERRSQPVNDLIISRANLDLDDIGYVDDVISVCQ